MLKFLNLYPDSSYIAYPKASMPRICTKVPYFHIFSTRFEAVFRPVCPRMPPKNKYTHNAFERQNEANTKPQGASLTKAKSTENQKGIPKTDTPFSLLIKSNCLSDAEYLLPKKYRKVPRYCDIPLPR